MPSTRVSHSASSITHLLSLAAALFSAISIDFPDGLLEQRWLLYTLLSLAHGLGICMLRHHASLFERLILALRLLLKGRLMTMALVAILFLAAPPFTGPAPLALT